MSTGKQPAEATSQISLFMSEDGHTGHAHKKIQVDSFISDTIKPEKNRRLAMKNLHHERWEAEERDPCSLGT